MNQTKASRISRHGSPTLGGPDRLPIQKATGIDSLKTRPAVGAAPLSGPRKEPEVNRLIRNALMLTAAVGMLASTAMAQNDYPWQPDRPINIVVPWAAGGSTDQVTRVMAAELEEALGTSVVVVNQPGASGSIGTTNVLNADKDGYTWAAGAVRDLGTYAVLDMLDTRLEDWHLYFAVSNTGVIAVNANTPYQTFDDLLQAMLDRPGQVTVATAGLSSAGHTVIEAIAAATGITYRHIPYDGGNP